MEEDVAAVAGPGDAVLFRLVAREATRGALEVGLLRKIQRVDLIFTDQFFPLGN